MSEADAQEGTPITLEGVTVEKTYEMDEFPVPAVMFVIESERDDPATIRLTDPLPPGVSTDDVGLHPNYGEESLSIEGDHVALERELEPGEEFTAVYGLREVDEDDLASAPTTPEDVEATPALDEAESSSQIVRDVIEGAGEEEDEEVESLELRDPDEEAATEASAETGPSTDTEPSTAPEADTDIELERGTESPEADDDLDAAITRADEAEPAAIGEGIASALAAELRAGRVDDDDLELLRDELEFGSGSDQARIQRLQTEMSDLQAYTDALEEFLDENGPARQLLSDLQSQVEHLESTLGRTTERVEAHDETVDDLESTVGSVESELHEFGETLEDHDEALEEFREFEETLESHDEPLEELREQAAAATDVADDLREDLEMVESRVEEQVADVETTVQGVEDRIGSVEDGVSDALDDVDELREDFETLDTEVGEVDEVDDRVDDLEETVEDMSEDLEEVADIQQRLQSVFGGGGDGGGDGEE
jgi:chromosome segregation ATPase